MGLRFDKPSVQVCVIQRNKENDKGEATFGSIAVEQGVV
jgi:hypothetical protein